MTLSHMLSVTSSLQMFYRFCSSLSKTKKKKNQTKTESIQTAKSFNRIIQATQDTNGLNFDHSKKKTQPGASVAGGRQLYIPSAAGNAESSSAFSPSSSTCTPSKAFPRTPFSILKGIGAGYALDLLIPSSELHKLQ